MLYNDRLGTVIKHATPLGAQRIGSIRWEWDVAGNCESPKAVELHSRPSGDHRRSLRKVVIKPGKQHALVLELAVRCRRCRNCLRSRMSMWTARAMHEVRNATRTWFATFTFRPEVHYTLQCAAIAEAAERSIPTKELSADELFARQSTKHAEELTKFLKRVRKRVGTSQMRYLLVREKHKSGLPHYHALIHESGQQPIPYRVLAEEWTHGHAQFKLMEDERAAFYVAKYLGKSNDGRVRASLRYGRAPASQHPPQEIANEESVLSEYKSAVVLRLQSIREKLTKDGTPPSDLISVFPKTETK